jgi:ergothioneine biosynthesis protein EgtB
MSLRLTEGLSAEDQMLQSMPDASPTKWHLAHTTWFFETFVLEPNVRGYRVRHPRFKHLFNSYYKQLGSHPHRASRGLMSRPSLREVLDYRAYIDEAIARHVEELPPDAVTLLELGLNHEQQHQELMVTDVKHGLWSGPLGPEEAAERPGPRTIAPKLKWVEFAGGIVNVGHEGGGFSFDNECPRHEVLLRPFALATRAVTNGEYVQFMADGGYRRPELWLSEGWDTVVNQQWTAPLYWERRDDGRWWQFTNKGMTPVDSAEPVCHISYFEADAYARWSGCRLPSEQEWELAANQNATRGAMLEDMTLRPQAAKGDGMQQLFGDVWEWTASPYMPYPGFVPAAGLIGEYNGKFMCNQMVLRGGSCATPASHIRATYRNFFPPHARWQFSGIRLAK